MAHAHQRECRFAFKEDPHTSVFLCAHVAQGADVLYVSHDADGDWQFLCGAIHDPEKGDEPVIQCLEHIVARDPSLNELAGLCSSHRAERKSADSPWAITDEAEEFIQSAVRGHGWAVQLIAPGDDEPGFAYTVGLFRSFGHPELIVFGLPDEVAHAVLNEFGERARAGAELRSGDRIPEVLEHYDVLVRGVRHAESFRCHVGYALSFYQGAEFPLLQVVWPDKEGRFPGDADAAEFLAASQPLLP